MRPDELVRLRQRYERLFGSEGVEAGECDAIEKILELRLPKPLREIAGFYGGGLLGGVSHHAIARHGPADNIVDETLRLRGSVSLPGDLIVLAEPPAGLIVLQAESDLCAAPVIWCSTQDVAKLASREPPSDSESWPDYAAFFGYLLALEEDEQGVEPLK